MTSMTLKALPLTVFREAESQTDCTNGGVSSTHTRLQLVGYTLNRTGIIDPLPEGITTEIHPGQDAPVVLHVRHIYNQYSLSFVPLTYDHTNHNWCLKNGHMAGGNYATGDSRIPELAAKLTGSRFYGAIAIHDRHEG